MLRPVVQCLENCDVVVEPVVARLGLGIGDIVDAFSCITQSESSRATLRIESHETKTRPHDLHIGWGEWRRDRRPGRELGIIVTSEKESDGSFYNRVYLSKCYANYSPRRAGFAHAALKATAHIAKKTDAEIFCCPSDEDGDVVWRRLGGKPFTEQTVFWSRQQIRTLAR